MKALILNSGYGSRMGELTKKHPKCMTQISKDDTILSRQLKALVRTDIKEVIITTGYYDDVLINYCNSLQLPLNITFIKNPMFDKTNYIYSIYCARYMLNDDLVLMHGDIVFEEKVLEGIIKQKQSCIKVSSTLPIPQKDFKAVIRNGRVYSIGVEFFTEVMEAQALYKLNYMEWKKWLDKIIEYCEDGRVNCYAEVAFNEISDECEIYGYDVANALCTEIDTPEDLKNVILKLNYQNNAEESL